jgi:L-xylulose reductase
MASFDFKEKKYLVTGAGRGIGRAIAKALVAKGCKVYALNRSKEPLDTLVSEHPEIVPIVADVRDWEDIHRKLDAVDTLDGLINNAVTYPPRELPALQWDRANLQDSIDGNILGPINILQIVAQKMVASERPGSIVNISSVASLQAIPGRLPYCMTKAALDMITKQFALELGPYNIRVNSINPTLVLTENIQSLIDTGIPVPDMYIPKTPMKRVARMEEIVSPVLYLLSDQSSMVTGTLQVIDGGIMATFATKTSG